MLVGEKKRFSYFYPWIVFFKQSILYFTKFHSRQNIYLRLRNTGSVSAFSKKNPVFPAVDILGTIIALNWPANKGLFMPTARPTEFDCSSKPVIFHWNVATLPGVMGGVTWSVMYKMFILAREQALLPFRSSALAASPLARTFSRKSLRLPT